MSEITRHPRPEKIHVPTGQLNDFLAVEAIRTVPLKMAAAATEMMGGRVLRKQGNIPLYQKRNMQEYFRNEGSTYTNFGDNLAHK